MNKTNYHKRNATLQHRGKKQTILSILLLIILVVSLCCALINNNLTGFDASLTANIKVVSSCFKDKSLNNTEPNNFETTAQNACVIEANSGRILFSKNENEQVPMASTTKILTALTVLNKCNDLSDKVTVPWQASNVEGSSIYLKKDELISVEDLLYGLMLRSGNDCAVALALHISESVEQFAKEMNLLANSLGARSSNFTNPHGLHDENHYTTAKDLALIACAAMKNEQFKQIVSSKKHIAQTRDNENNVFLNKNKLLYSMEESNGVKTGYTKKAGRCFVASAEKNGMEIVVVLLNCVPMFEEAQSILNFAFSSYTMTDIVYQNMPLISIIKPKRAVIVSKDTFSVPLLKDGSEDKKTKIFVKEKEDSFHVFFDDECLFTGRTAKVRLK